MQWVRPVLFLTLLVVAGVYFLRPNLGGTREADTVDLSYTVRLLDASRARVEVELTIDGLEPGPIEIGYSANAVAATAPVSKFRLREALDANGAPLSILKDDGRWPLPDPGGSLRLRYEVWLDLGRGDSAYSDEVLSRLDEDGGRWLGSDIFLFPLYCEATDIEVQYEGMPADWQLIHPFQEDDRSARVPNLRALYGSVCAVGPYRTLTRWVGNCEVVLAVQGDYAFGDPDLAEVIERIVSHQVEFFGQAPRSRYLFLVNPHPDANDPDALHYFGLHFDSSMIVLLDPRTDRQRLQGEPASLCAHEFFHNWLGEVLSQDDYQMNWFVEGVTTWYAYRTRLATRMLDNGQYASQLAARYERQLRRHPLRSTVSVAKAGSHVLQDPEFTSLLYSGGLFLAVALDAAIDEATDHDYRLDEVLRRMVDHAINDPEYRLTRASLEAELKAVTGKDFGPWLERHVYGVQPAPLPAYVTETSVSR